MSKARFWPPVVAAACIFVLVSWLAPSLERSDASQKPGVLLDAGGVSSVEEDADRQSMEGGVLTAPARQLAGVASLDLISTDNLEPREFGSQAISIGEDLDPEDPSTWPRRGQIISVGEDMDPEDPSTWPKRSQTISVGEDLDPENPASWPSSRKGGVISVGEDLDPDEIGTTLATGRIRESISVGDDLDPEDPGTWNRK